MKKLFLSVLILIINVGCAFSQPNYYSDLLDKGNEAFLNKEYAVADSIYTICIEKSTNGDIYFNRAFSRLYLSDTCGYCYDLQIASRGLFDKEAFNYYYKDCIESVDTLYYSNDMNKVKSKYRYYEVIFKPICDSLKYYEFHDKRKKEYVTSVNLNDITTVETGPKGHIDYLALAYYTDSTKVFIYLKNLNFNEMVDKYYEDYIQKKTEVIRKEYYQIKTYIEETVEVKMLVDNNGKVLKTEVMESETLNSEVPNYDKFREEVENIFSNITAIKPIEFQDKPIYYRGIYYFKF